MNVSEIICPVCKTKNELQAIVCVHCGAALDNSGRKAKTSDLQAAPPEIMRDWSFKEAMIPESGMAVYVEGDSNPAHIDSNGEFVLGRRSGTTSGLLVDLSPFRAYSLGVSRRHVAIRRTGDSYEVMDLGSVNGTFLNEERLVPHQSYRLPSGSHLRLGGMQILVLYRPFAETK
jgi:hypothetical protein